MFSVTVERRLAVKWIFRGLRLCLICNYTFLNCSQLCLILNARMFSIFYILQCEHVCVYMYKYV
jgi:hypothetical protein